MAEIEGCVIRKKRPEVDQKLLNLSVDIEGAPFVASFGTDKSHYVH